MIKLDSGSPKPPARGLQQLLHPKAAKYKPPPSDLTWPCACLKLVERLQATRHALLVSIFLAHPKPSVAVASQSIGKHQRCTRQSSMSVVAYSSIAMAPSCIRRERLDWWLTCSASIWFQLLKRYDQQPGPLISPKNADIEAMEHIIPWLLQAVHD